MTTFNEVLEEWKRVDTIADQARKDELARHAAVWRGFFKKDNITKEEFFRAKALWEEEKVRHKENKAIWEVVFGENGIVRGQSSVVLN